MRKENLAVLVLVLALLIQLAPLMILPARSTADAPKLLMHYKCNQYDNWARKDGGVLPDTYFNAYGLMGFLHDAYEDLAAKEWAYTTFDGRANITAPVSGWSVTELNFTVRINNTQASNGGVWNHYTNRTAVAALGDNWVHMQGTTHAHNSTNCRLRIMADSEDTAGSKYGDVYPRLAYLDDYAAHEVFYKFNSSSSACFVSAYFDNVAVFTNQVLSNPMAGLLGFEAWNQEVSHYFGPIVCWGSEDSTAGEIEAGYEFPGIDAAILNVEGCGDWVFVEERYYKLNITVEHGSNASLIETVRARFPCDTPDGVINSTFTYRFDNWTVAFNDVNGTYDGLLEPTQTRNGNLTYASDWGAGYFVFEIWFTQWALDEYEDKIDVDVWANDTNGDSYGWATAGADVFYIYNHGGFTWNLTTTGDAQLISGGEIFSFKSPNASSIYRDYYFRNLAHFKILPELVFNVGVQSFALDIGIDYCTQNDDWVNGWYAKITIDGAAYGTERWVNYTVAWHNDGVQIKTDNVYMFHHGDAAIAEEITYHRFWVDLWFNKENASGTGGGRINAYEYPMRDNANAWLRWLSSNWGVRDNVSKSSMYMGPLQDSTGPITTAQIKMVKVWARLLTQTAETEQDVYLSNFLVFDLSFADIGGVFTGIQTPAFEETQLPTMPQGGFIGVLASTFSFWIQWLGDNLIYGGLSIWPKLVAFLDTVAAFAGFPGGFTILLAFVSDAVASLVDSLSWLGTILVSYFSFAGSGMAKFITLIAEVLTQWAAILMGVWSFLDGSYTAGINVFTDLGVWNWIVLFAIVYPLHLIFLWDEEGFSPVEREIRLIWDGLAFIASSFIKVIMLVQAVIGRIIESIPVAE